MSLQSEDNRGQAEHLGRPGSSEGLKQDGCLNSSLGPACENQKGQESDTDSLAQNNLKETNTKWQEKWETNKKTKQRNKKQRRVLQSAGVLQEELSQPAEGGREGGGKKKAFLPVRSQPTVDNLGKEGSFFSSPVPSFE